MKQQNLFGDEFEVKEKSQYTSTINLPTYTPSRLKPDVFILCDTLKNTGLAINILAQFVAKKTGMTLDIPHENPNLLPVK